MALNTPDAAFRTRVCALIFGCLGMLAPALAADPPRPAAPASPAAAPADKTTSFKLFLSLSYPGVPKDLPKQIGAQPLNCFSQTPFIWDQPATATARPQTAARMKRGIAQMNESVAKYGDPYWPFGDAEHLCLDWTNFWNLVGQATVDQADPKYTITRANLRKFTESATRFREALNDSGLEGRKFGFRGVAPIDAWSTHLAKPGSEAYERQVGAHRLPEMTELVAAVDFLSTTTQLSPNPSEDYWAHIENTLKLAREIKQGKPLYVFVVPQYANAPGYMETTNWLRQLDLARKYADGVVISSSYRQQGADQKWNPDSEWWRTTLQWIEKNR